MKSLLIPFKSINTDYRWTGLFYIWINCKLSKECENLLYSQVISQWRFSLFMKHCSLLTSVYTPLSFIIKKRKIILDKNFPKEYWNWGCQIIYESFDFRFGTLHSVLSGYNICGLLSFQKNETILNLCYESAIALSFSNI